MTLSTSNFPDPIWSEWSPRIISVLNLKKASANEWKGPCPNCGGVDRFWLNEFQGNARVNCRKCDDFKSIAAALVNLGAWPEVQSFPTKNYAATKGVGLHSAQLQGNNVVINLFNFEGQLIGTQTIYPGGQKKFNKGLKKEGVYALVGKAPEGVTYVAEGWATAASIFQCTNRPSIFGLDAGNIPSLLVCLRQIYPDAEFILALDNDAAGRTAAAACDAPACFPPDEGKDWNDIMLLQGQRKTGKLIVAQTSVDAPSTCNDFQVLSAADLLSMTLPPPEWIIPDLLPVGLAILAGPPKVGKSWLALHFALKIAASGQHCLYLSLEDNNRRIKERLISLVDHPPQNLSVLAGLSNEKQIPRGEEAISLLKNFHKQNPIIKTIIVDTVQGIRQPSKRGEKGYEETVGEWSALRKVAHDLGIALLAVHHTGKKTSDAERTPIERIMGSQGIAGTAETIMVLEQVVGSQSVTLHLTGKDVEQQEIAYTWLSPGFAEEGDARYAALGSFQKSVLNYVKGHPRCTQAGIAEELQRQKSQVSEAVSRLCEKGFVTKRENTLIAILDT